MFGWLAAVGEFAFAGLGAYELAYLSISVGFHLSLHLPPPLKLKMLSAYDFQPAAPYHNA